MLAVVVRCSYLIRSKYPVGGIECQNASGRDGDGIRRGIRQSRKYVFFPGKEQRSLRVQFPPPPLDENVSSGNTKARSDAYPTRWSGPFLCADSTVKCVPTSTTASLREVSCIRPGIRRRTLVDPLLLFWRIDLCLLYWSKESCGTSPRPSGERTRTPRPFWWPVYIGLPKNGRQSRSTNALVLRVQNNPQRNPDRWLRRPAKNYLTA
jgi:hypothetical protein